VEKRDDLAAPVVEIQMRVFSVEHEVSGVGTVHPWWSIDLASCKHDFI
jgi:hypothetical protein